MILFFTGTGNSKYIADALADRLKDEVVSLNEIIKNNSKREFTAENCFVIVAPIYAWRYPRVVDELLSEAKFKGAKEIYFVATMGSQTGKCDKYCKNIAEAAGLSFMGFRGIKMPNNYIVGSKLDDASVNDAIIAEASTSIDEIAEAIRKHATIAKTDRTPVSALLSGPVNNAFSKHMCSAKSYVVSDSCISCGSCVQLCPVNNVALNESGRPVFGDKCINCLACLQYCPKQAINIPGKTDNQGRYTCREYGNKK